MPAAPSPGFLQLHAAIAALHADAPVATDTDWGQILALYDQLAALTSSPMVALNRAVAVGEVEGPASALGLIEGPALDHYHPYHAALVTFLERLGHRELAAADYDRAIALTDNQAEQDLPGRSGSGPQVGRRRNVAWARMIPTDTSRIPAT